MNWMIEDYELEARLADEATAEWLSDMAMEDEWRNSPEAQEEYALWRDEMYRDVHPPIPEKE